jgi:hypothetical protein
MKAAADSLAQKTAALEAQSEASIGRSPRPTASIERCGRSTRHSPAAREREEPERHAGGRAGAALAPRRSAGALGPHSQLQRQAEEQTGIIRHELTAAQDEMKEHIERFDFEGKGLESVSQRVADLRGALSDFENRYQGYAKPARRWRN